VKRWRGQVIVAMTSVLAVVGGGVATADPLAQEKDTSSGGYRMRLSMQDVTIQSVPNMAAAPLVREGYITATAMLGVTCKEGEGKCPEQVVRAALEVSAQVGCPIDLSGGIELQPQATLDLGLPNSLGALLPVGGDITTINIAPTLQNVGPGPIRALIKPGYIDDIRLEFKNIPPTTSELDALDKAAELAVAVNNAIPDEKRQGPDGVQSDLAAVGQRIEAVLNRKVTDGDLVASIQNRHIVVDRNVVTGDGACGGPVAIRLHAQGTMSTVRSSDKVDIYSDILSL